MNYIIEIYKFKLNQMEPIHQTHHAKPKIAKNASSKLPQAFRMQGAVSKRVSQPVSQEPKYYPAQIKSQIKQKKHQLKGDRKSKNPFLPIKQFIKKASEFTREMREANNDLNNFDRFAKYSIQGDKFKNKYKYQNCLTLTVVRKSANGCLKKVLHVPTLSVHYLKQSLISSHFDKNELNQWIHVINREEESCMRILQLFWNMPQDYYSLLYEYSEGLLLDSLNQSLHTLPLSLLKEIAALHLGSSLAIFNSHIILHQEGNMRVIRYLPIYEESEFSVSEMVRLKEIMQLEVGSQDGARIGRKFSWKLGLLILNGYIGTPIFSQQILKIQLPLKKCCLFHEIMSINNSLAALYIQIGGFDGEIADFLCHCLTSKRNAQRHIELKEIRKSKWIVKQYNQIITLGELIEVVNPSFGSHSKFQLEKVARIMESVGLILQNVSGVDISINADNRGVVHLVRELGMSGEIEKVVTDLRRVYRSDKN